MATLTSRTERRAARRAALLLWGLGALAGCAVASPPPAPPPARPHAPAPPQSPCTGLAPVATAPPALGALVPLGILGAAVEIRTPDRSARPIELGRIPPTIRLGRATTSFPRVVLSRPRVPRELARAALSEGAFARWQALRAAEAALREERARRDPTPRAAACLAAREDALLRARAELRAALAVSAPTPSIDVLAAELALEDADRLDDAHLADLALAQATAQATRARDALALGEPAAFFARLLLADARGRTGPEEPVLEALRPLIGRPAPLPLLEGEAELRAADLERDGAARAALLLAAIAAAPHNDRVRFGARARALEDALEADAPERGAALCAEIMADLPASEAEAADALVGEALAQLLPRVPTWWSLKLPALSPQSVQLVAEALAQESDRRGDRQLARRLRSRALELPPTGQVADLVRRQLAVGGGGTVDLAQRVGRLASECDASVDGRRKDVVISLDARGLEVAAGRTEDAYAACLRRWAPGYLTDVEPLRATLPATAP